MTLGEARTPSARFHYAWVIVGVTFVILIAAAGVRSVPSVLIVPLEEEFGWSRATISLAVSINLLLFGALGPFAASLMDRVGMRRMIVAALSILTVAVALTTQMNHPWQLLLLWGGMVGLGAGVMSGWLSATVATRWFVTRRGVVVGTLTAAGATGQLIFLPLLARIVETAGWRPAVALVAITTALIVPLVVFLMRNFPEDRGLLPYGALSETDIPAGRAPIAGNPFKAAVETLASSVRDRNFRLLAFSFFICGATTNGLIGTHLIPMAHDHGLTEVTAASLLAVIGVFDIIGTMGSGWLSDRFDNRRLLCWYYSLRGLSLLFLPFAFEAGVPGVALFVVFYGLDWVATVPPTVRLTGDLFGAQRVGTVYAWMLASHQLGASMAAYAAGAMRTSLGDYRLTFFIAGGLALIAGMLVLQVARPTDKAGSEANVSSKTPEARFSTGG
ncbi:MAG: MFS transporter [Chloroflexi bacterium]|nr:MFS transporter [Chloroflexota bacterium]